MLCLVVAWLAIGCHGKVKPDECSHMLDRYIDMSIDADPATRALEPAQAEAVRAMKHAVKKAEPTYAKAEAQCKSEVSRQEFECAMAAKNPDEWEACIE